MVASIGMNMMGDLSTQQIENQVEGVDYFDLLPDPILPLIFNKLFDAKSLCRCLVVSKRFASLVTEVDSISIKLNNRPKSKKPIEDHAKSSSGSNSFLKNSVFKFIYKPIHLLQQAILSKKMSSLSKNSGNNVDILKWVGNTLKNFNDVQSLNLELPCHGGEIGINKNIPLLKWEAEFGKEMEKCAILGANSIVEKSEKKVGYGEEEWSNENDVNVFSDEELKLRIIWIISCLIASSARHNLVKKMVGQCPKLNHAMISDAGKQGKLCMNAVQIRELKESVQNSDKTEDASVKSDLKSESESVPSDDDGSTTPSSMGYAGNLVMKLWYVKELELPNSGKVMKGATLVVIKPEKKDKEKEKEKEGDVLSMWRLFNGEKDFEEAATELLKRKEKRMYRLEMNSF